MTSTVHRRALLVVKQSDTGVSCELVARKSISPDISGICGSCGACAGRSARNTINFEIPATAGRQNSIALNPGDTVEVTAPAGVLLTLSSVVYFLPVVLMLFFSVCGDLLFPSSEARVALSAVFGLGLGFGAIFLLRPALRSYIMKRLTVCSSFDKPRLF